MFNFIKSIFTSSSSIIDADDMDSIYEKWSVLQRQELEELEREEDEMYERWNAREIQGIKEDYDNMEGDDNPFDIDDLQSLQWDYWGYQEINPFRYEDLNF